MREKKDYCPRCNQYRLLRSINYIGDRIYGITINKEGKFIDYLCYNCLEEIDKGIKKGKRFVELIGNNFVVTGFGLPKYMHKIFRKLKIEHQSIDKALNFINFIYRRWVEIDPNEKFKYHFASLFIVLRNDEKRRELEEFIKTHHKNFPISELKEKVEEINKWAKKPNLLDRLYDSL